MTEKRFTNHITKTDADGTIHTDGIFDANENNKILITNYFYIAQVMNELHNENEQLKTRLDFCSSVNKETNKQIKLVEEKNEDLKQSLGFCKDNVKRLHDENEQLKKEIKKLRDFQETVYKVSFGRDDVDD